MGKKFSLDWEHKFGWHGDPFQDHIPDSVEVFLVGVDAVKEKLNLFVLKSHQFGLIRGPEGSGKTMIAHWLKDALREYGEKVEVVHLEVNKNFTDPALCKLLAEPYLSYAEKHKKKDESYNFENVLDAMQNVTKKKRFIFVVDGLEKLTRDALFTSVKLFALPNVQVVATCSLEFYKSLPKTVKARDELKIELKGLTLPDIKGFLARRIEFFGGNSTEPFEDKEVQQLVKKSEGNPRVLLKEAKELALKKSLSKEMPAVLPKRPVPQKKESEARIVSVGNLRIKFLPNEVQEPVWVLGGDVPDRSVPEEEEVPFESEEAPPEDVPAEETKVEAPPPVEDKQETYKKLQSSKTPRSELELNEALIQDLAAQSHLTSQKDLKTTKKQKPK